MYRALKPRIWKSSWSPTESQLAARGKPRKNAGRDKTIYHEHCSNEILRVLDLPAELDASGAEAKLKNGVLEILMPKGKATTTRVQVKARTGLRGGKMRTDTELQHAVMEELT